jgi:hypothetical protein
MAQKGPRGRRRARNAPVGAADSAASGKQWPPPAGSPASLAREVRPYIFAGFDFAMALIYTLLLLQVSTRHTGHAILLWSMVGGAALAGVGMLLRNRWGRRAGILGCAVLIAVTVLLLILILASASFLSGVYGSMGQGGAMMALLAGAFIIELVGLLPAFQLKFLMTRAGRRYFAATGATR